MLRVAIFDFLRASNLAAGGGSSGAHGHVERASRQRGLLTGLEKVKVQAVSGSDLSAVAGELRRRPRKVSRVIACRLSGDGGEVGVKVNRLAAASQAAPSVISRRRRTKT